MLSPTVIYGSALLVFTWQFLEGLQEEKHTRVKRGAAPSNCYHSCPGGDGNCYFDNNINDFRCKCPCWSKYCGYLEENCNNRGTCVAMSGNTDFTCNNCIAGWKGKRCHLIDCDSGLYCTNEGVCVDDINGGTDYRCICKEGWTGKDCQFIDCSSPIRCMNEGQCHLQNGGKEFNCTCADGYLGDNCQIDMCSPYKIADIVFIIDVSDSQDRKVFDEQKNFVKYFIAQFPLGPDHFQFSLVLYASEPHAVFNLSNTYDNNTIIDAVDNVTIPDDIHGATFTDKALAFVKDHSFVTTNGGRADVDRYIIILTDGMSSKSIETVNQAKELRLSYPNIRIKSIGSGKYVFHKELLDICASLLNVFPQHGNDSVRSVQKSTMYGCKRCTKSYSDVAVAFDISSFNYGQLDAVLKTAEALITNLHTDNNQTRVSLSTYESVAEEVFEFDKYRTSYDMITAMNKHVQKRETCKKDGQCSRTNISSLLQDISSEFHLNSEKSRRKAVIIFSQFTFDKDSSEHVFREIQNLKDDGVFVVVVGEGPKANIDNMLKLSTTPFFTFIIGEDLNTPIEAILALLSTLEYDICFA
ncbi:collagen alpha-4(VI) chain-like [Dreissena polymorpha]|uniref:Uncharacterized protein n=1 Tax=Dreissena polymorpha TaxID=45954 RepID=A0A9D3YDL6_DREPO|nr:collagen alpha-4(VI) chain-like [Dreissena polymorpha]KAH3697201.1 hypothetical protein DPMN_084690 [Dreissena polymorpha]